MASHALATITNPASSLTDFTLIVDLSNMPSSWWAEVDTSDGTRGRVYKGDGSTRLAADWIDFDDTAETGLLRVLWSGTLASTGTQQLWIEPPVLNNATVAADNTYGSDNAYNSDVEAYWPFQSDANDRTINGNDLTASGSPSYSSGTIGNQAVLDGSADYFQANIAPVSAHPFAFMGLANHDNNTDEDVLFYFGDSSSSTAYFVGRIISENMSVWDRNAGSQLSTTGTDYADGTTRHFAALNFRPDATQQREQLYINGSLELNDWWSHADITGFDRIAIGRAGDATADSEWDGGISHVMFLSSQPSADLISYESDQLLDNATFYGAWSWETPTVITVDTDGVSGDYASLSAAVASLPNPLTYDYTIQCSASTGVADTAGLNTSIGLGGYTLTIRGDFSGTAWDTSAYRIETSAWTHGFNLSTDGELVVEGIQCYTENRHAFTFEGTTTKLRMVNCLGISDAGTGYFLNTTTLVDIVLVNCLAFSCGDVGFYNRATNTGVDVYFYNCVSVNNATYGFRTDAWRDSVLKNCYAGGCTTADYSVDANGTHSYTTCASSDGSGGTTVAFSTVSGAYFADVTSGSEDVSTAFASDLIDAGTDLSADLYYAFDTDIVGSLRIGSGDIGAYENTSATEVVRFIDPDTPAVPLDQDGLSWDTAYASIDAWNTAEATDLVSSRTWHHVYVRSSSGTADTTATTITGWTTSVYNYVLIEAADGDQALKTGWDATRYRFSVTDDNALEIQRPNVILSGLQIEKLTTSVDWRSVVYIPYITGSDPVTLRRCRVRAPNGNTYGVAITYSGARLVVESSIIEPTRDAINTTVGDVEIEVTQSTLWGDGADDGIQVAAGSRATVTNSVIANFSDDVNSSGTVFIDHCATDDGDGTNAVAPSGSDWANEFADPTTGDYSLLNTGNLYQAGAVLEDGPTTDIDGEPWEPVPSIGADESAVVRYVDPDASGAGDGTSWTDAYTSLSAMVTGEATDLVTAGDWLHVYCRASAGTADTSATINGFTTGASNYVLIESASTDRATKDDTSTAKYRIAEVIVWDDHVRIDGLQFVATADNDLLVFGNLGASTDLRVTNCRFDGNSDTGNFAMSCEGSITVETCIAVDFNNRGFSVTSGTADFYHCIARNCQFGGFRDSGGTTTAINCAAFDNYSSDYDIRDFDTVDHCATDGGVGTNSVSPSGSDWTNEFSDPANGDFTLLNTGNLFEGGTTIVGGPLTDIDGTSWEPIPSIGVDSPVEVIRYVDPDATGAGNGRSWTDAFTSLGALEAAMDGGSNSTRTLHIYVRSSAGTADSGVEFSGMTYSSITIEAASGHEALKTGWDTSRYRIEGTWSAIYSADSVPLHLIGLQIQVTRSANNGYGVQVNPSSPITCTMSDCRVRGVITSGDYQYGLYANSANITWNVYTSIFEGWNYTGSLYASGVRRQTGTINVYHSIAYGCGNGFMQADVVNSASFGNTDDFDGGTAVHCASDDGDGTNALAPSGGDWTNEFTDPANGNFSLLNTGNLYHGGTAVTDGPATDIDGDSWAVPPSVGVDEYTEISFYDQNVNVHEDFESSLLDRVVETDASAILDVNSTSDYVNGAAGAALNWSGGNTAYLSYNPLSSTVSGGFWFKGPALAAWEFGPRILELRDAVQGPVATITWRSYSGLELVVNATGGSDDIFVPTAGTWYWLAWKYTGNSDFEVEIYNESHTLLDTLTSVAGDYTINDGVRIGNPQGAIDSAVYSYYDDVVIDNDGGNHPILSWVPSGGTAYTRTLSDTTGITDNITREAEFVRQFLDTVGATDMVSAELQQLVSVLIQNGVGVDDAVNVVGTYLRNISDTVDVSDAAAVAIAHTLSIADSVGVSDTSTRILIYFRSFADTVGVTDALDTLVFQLISVSLSDGVSVSDTASRVATLIRTVIDDVTVTDVSTTIGVFIRTLTDTVGVTDALIASSVLLVQLADTVGITDEVVTQIALLIQAFIADNVGVTDSTSRALAARVFLEETLNVTDTVRTAAQFVRRFTDTVAIDDDLSRRLGVFVDLVESVSVTDTVDTAFIIDKFFDLAEAVGVSDAIVAQVLREGDDWFGKPGIVQTERFVPRGDGILESLIPKIIGEG